MLEDFFGLGSTLSIMSMMLAAHCFIKECGSSALIGCNISNGKQEKGKAKRRCGDDSGQDTTKFKAKIKDDCCI